jgi:GNAT superfamily N-acetyltransferase
METGCSSSSNFAVIRRGNRQDVRFLRDMLRHAFYWRSGGGVEDASLWRYVAGWGRRGDAAVVALEGGFPVGAAWFRLFARDEPGFGFVDEQTPEVAIAVVPSRRGHGIGSELLDALIALAREQGYGGLSLSVADDSPAMHVFQKQGFENVEQTDGSWTMRLNLA